MSTENEIIVDEKPTLDLPGGAVSISQAAFQLGTLLASGHHGYYLFRGAVSRLTTDNWLGTTVQPIRAAGLASTIEVVSVPIKGGQQTICNESTARLLLESEFFRKLLPPLDVLAQCPVLIERGGNLVTVTGYDRESHVLANGGEPESMTVERAAVLLTGLLNDFRFGSDSDKSRALAAFITPAFVMGGLFQGRAPIDLGEADSSQTGKGYRNKLTAAIYNDRPHTVTVSTRGVGSLENTFDKALVGGRTIIAIDNIRGRIDSPKLESFLTEDAYYARPTHSPELLVDPRRVVVMFTSNQADLTTDLANRCSCVRLLKQPGGYHFRRFPEGDLLGHVRANQPTYLGAVFALIRAWHAAGKPKTGETSHDFREWAQTLDWVVQNLLGAAPLLDGHRGTQARMTNPAVNWLRTLALEVVAQSKANEFLTASDLMNVMEVGGIEIPGVTGSLADDARKTALQQIGRKLSQAFKRAEQLQIDHLTVMRTIETDSRGHEIKRYMVLDRAEALDCLLPPGGAAA